MARIFVFICAIGVSQSAMLLSSFADEDVYKESRKHRRESKTRILKAIQKHVTLKFNDVALNDALDQISRLGNVSIIIDQQALDDEGILPTTAVSIQVADESIDRLLSQLLFKAELTWLIDGDAITVTSYQEHEAKSFVEIFKIDKLLAHAKESLKNNPQRMLIGGGISASQHGQQGKGNQTGGGFFQLPPSKPKQPSPPLINRQFGSTGSLGPQPMGLAPTITAEDLITDLIMGQTTGPWREDEGSGGSMRIVGDVLVVSHSFQVLREVGYMVDVLNKAIDFNGTAQLFHVRDPSYPIEKELKTISQMQQRLDWSFKDSALSSVLAKFSSFIGVPLKPDEIALAEEGISLEDQVTFQARQLSIESALTRILETLGMTFFIDGNHIVITTSICAEEALSTVIHQTFDLNKNGMSNEEVREILYEVSSAMWYDIDGTGGGLFAQFDGILVVTQTKAELRAVADTLAELRRSKPQKQTSSPQLTVRSYRLDNLPMNPEQTKNMHNNAVHEASMTILSLVEPESWTGEHAGSIHTVGRLLVIKQTVAVHQKIEAFIAKHFRRKINSDD